MNVRAVTGLAFVTLGAAAAATLSAQTSSSAPPLPRTSWGDPSIEGTYTNKDEFGTPFERPDELAGKQRREFGPEQMKELMVEQRGARFETVGHRGDIELRHEALCQVRLDVESAHAA